MHDIGSARPGGWGTGYNEFEHELSGETAGEFGHEQEGAFGHEFETEFEQGESEFENEFETEVSGEMQEMELAAELLAVNSEQEMEQFLGGLIKSVGRVATNFAKSSAGKALGGILRSAAKSALPIVGSALGNLVLPGAGGLIGGKLAGMAGSALGLELEGLSNEDREFEVARRLVRIGQHAAHHLSSMPRNVPPARAARIAFLRGARQVAPGLLPAMRAISQGGIAGARQLPMPIFGAPAAAPRAMQPAFMGGQPAFAGGQPDYAGAGAAYAPAPPMRPMPGGYPTPGPACPTCGAGPAHVHVAQGGTWRRSRNGHAIILYLAPRRQPY
ncbi:hypothetical protein AB4Z48_12375 [Cupriavidus sp. 2TAF22]|uniref:hypothetical protein n=1 Tax=unclassified Cupriavidus TaxID=2640874 RepID=UPI003F8F07FB